MTAKIRILDGALADQIAAGEVVERPASVVKELIENALDAGARRITVEMDGGGLTRVRVTDDGAGMSPEDAQLCVKRHATSKLRVRDDLFAIRTLGFRGEALPSIASVARFTLRTRTAESLTGTQLIIEGGEAREVGEVGCAVGTSVEVRDLFFNVPARRKFLRSRSTESGHVTDVCIRAALAHPHVHLVLLRDGRQARELLPANDWLARCMAAFPKETLTPLEGSREGITLRAALSAPERARAGAGGLHLFVNGRPVRDNPLARAVAYAYGSVLPPGRYPIGVVLIDLDPGEVDVNVHPQKAEVRFARTRPVLEAVTRILAGPLGASRWAPPAAVRPAAAPHADPLPAAPLPGWTRPPNAGAPLTSDVRPYPHASGALARSSAAWAAENLPRPSPVGAAPQQAMGEAGFFGGLRVLGQVHHMFIVCEDGEALLVVDQHAADERVRFHRLKTAYERGEVKTQRLLFPERVTLSPQELALIEAHRDQVARMGLDCNTIATDTLAVHAVPVLLMRATPERIVRDLVDELARAGDRAFHDAVDKVLATMACHAAIRAGDPLSPDECQALLAALDDIDQFAGYCPHGRPVVCRLGFAELERRLGR